MLRRLQAPARLLVPAILFAAFSNGGAVRAETRVTGEPDAVRIEARDAPLAEVLEALGDSFGLQYRSTASLSRRVSGTYEGSLQRVVRRLLDGHDFIMKTGPGNLEVKVYGPVDSGEARLAPNTAPGPRAAQVAPVPKVTTTPHVTTTPQVTTTPRSQKGRVPPDGRAADSKTGPRLT